MARVRVALFYVNPYYNAGCFVGLTGGFAFSRVSGICGIPSIQPIFGEGRPTSPWPYFVTLGRLVFKGSVLVCLAKPPAPGVPGYPQTLLTFDPRSGTGAGVALQAAVEGVEGDGEPDDGEAAEPEQVGQVEAVDQGAGGGIAGDDGG